MEGVPLNCSRFLGAPPSRSPVAWFFQSGSIVLNVYWQSQGLQKYLEENGGRMKELAGKGSRFLLLLTENWCRL